MARRWLLQERGGQAASLAARRVARTAAAGTCRHLMTRPAGAPSARSAQPAVTKDGGGQLSGRARLAEAGKLRNSSVPISRLNRWRRGQGRWRGGQGDGADLEPPSAGGGWPRAGWSAAGAAESRGRSRVACDRRVVVRGRCRNRSCRWCLRLPWRASGAGAPARVQVKWWGADGFGRRARLALLEQHRGASARGRRQAHSSVPGWRRSAGRAPAPRAARSPGGDGAQAVACARMRSQPSEEGACRRSV